MFPIAIEFYNKKMQNILKSYKLLRAAKSYQTWQYLDNTVIKQSNLNSYYLEYTL